MRIISGKYKRRRVHTPHADADNRLRPTSDRARETVFNMLSVILDFDMVTVLDLFAGTGAFGYEALSRGAEHVTFVDNSKLSRELISKTAAELDSGDKVQFVMSDALNFLSAAGNSYDLVFADPPYNFSEYKALMTLVMSLDFQIFVLEHEYKVEIPDEMIDREVYDVSEKDVGKSSFKFIIKKD